MKKIWIIIGVIVCGGCAPEITEPFESLTARQTRIAPAETSDASEGSGEATDGEERSSTGTPAGGASHASATKTRPDFLVINEVLYDVTGSDTDGRSFIELFGTAAADIDGYRIVFYDGERGSEVDTVTLPQGAGLREDGLYLVADAKTGKPGESFIEGADAIDNFDPQNGPDCLVLFDDKGEVQDAVGYGESLIEETVNGFSCFEGLPSEDVSSDVSLSRKDGVDTDDNATDFHQADIPTPGVF